MAVTHDDLAPSPKSSDLGSKTGAFLMVFSIILGLFCFILCLIAEATRSEVKWTATNDEGKGIESQCTYTGSGRLPLLTASAAFLALAMAMLVQHTYLLIAVSKSDSLVEIAWDPDSAFARTLTCQAGFFFVSTWASFAVGEVLLLIGLSVESGHLKNWATPQPSCLIIRQGLFTAGGIFGLATVFLASGLYITALRADTYFQEQENTRQQILEASAMYASPPGTPGGINNTIRAVHNEYPLPRQENRNNLHTLYYYLTAFDKQSSLV
ncbi:hypothetical protein PHJA_000671200 [Phtheirospermum japonicum]|uniref:Uncharacterized protein n=1 Tax=Phtheirospermum japonicum TaxID=374723 RepID=A0A830BN21_9LAMI|nr:hypothetical protein PHJA_000671200 [Phtheirospermum japonicum]